MRERLEMVKAADLGLDLQEVALWSGRTPRTVRRWLGGLASGGIGGLADAPRLRGVPSWQTPLICGRWRRRWRPRRASWAVGFDVWTSERLSAYLAQKTDARIAPGWLRVLLGKTRFASRLACGRPKHTLSHLGDPGEVAACEAELAEAEKK